MNTIKSDSKTLHPGCKKGGIDKGPRRGGGGVEDQIGTVKRNGRGEGDRMLPIFFCGIFISKGMFLCHAWNQVGILATGGCRVVMRLKTMQSAKKRRKSAKINPKSK